MTKKNFRTIIRKVNNAALPLAGTIYYVSIMYGNCGEEDLKYVSLTIHDSTRHGEIVADFDFDLWKKDFDVYTMLMALDKKVEQLYCSLKQNH